MMPMTQQSEENDVLAAIDLGSNSFHMILSRLRDGHFQVIDKLREMVQLRAGLDEHGYLSDEAQERAIACLAKFGERIKNLPAENVRVVGTNTLRVAKNSPTFLRKARIALKYPIEIIQGEEEARLIYLGVAHSLAFDNSRRLVMDIGGGSTEFIIGEGFDGLRRESLEMGCVSFSQQFFSNGWVSSERMRLALITAGSRLRAIQRPYRAMGWTAAIGASGTIRTVANIVRENGWADDGVITPESLDSLIEKIVEVDHIDELKLDGLSGQRKSVLPGGVAVLKASFERLQIDKMIVSDGALREGLLYDLLGRIQHDDERDRTVLALARRYQMDEAHAERVRLMAVQFFDQVKDEWDINDEASLDRLQWAAKLHEVGLAIGHSSFHKHSAYLVGNSDLPGFSREEQHALALIVQGQRKSFPKKDLKDLPEELLDSTQKIIILLRLAMVFNRGRSERTDTGIKLKAIDKGISIGLPLGWLSRHPLTEADLNQEADYLKSIKFKLKLKDF
jgi:exopolyphosphatase/guanosine-5'-triphosphate,3'-diphosphate pyrophosphatase